LLKHARSFEKNQLKKVHPTKKLIFLWNAILDIIKTTNLSL